MFCDKCGAKNHDDARFCTGCGREFKRVTFSNEKNMIAALILSFILPGIGIAYAGNVKRGIIIFAVSFIFNILGFGLSFFRIIGILIWIFALYLTYVEVEKANGCENPNILNDFKTWPAPKKAGSVIVVVLILLIAVGGVMAALTPSHYSTTPVKDYSSSSSSSSNLNSYSPSSSSGSSGSYSSSSNGHDVESHYDGDYGSADTYGTVYDDGSVESHQTGHTDYGDYQIDSYMDSNGNIHGTVDAGGRTYHINR